MKLTSRTLLAGGATFLALLTWLVVVGLAPRPAYACTGSIEDLSLDYFTREADAIALVDVSEVGGAGELPLGPFPDGRHFTCYLLLVTGISEVASGHFLQDRARVSEGGPLHTR